MTSLTSRLRGLAIAATCAFAPAAYSSAAEAMTFRLVQVGGASCGAKCPQVISAEGQIDRDSADEFVAFLKSSLGAANLRNVVFMHSPGGSVIGAMKLGAVFRKAGAAVVVARARSGQGLDGDSSFTTAQCLSACVYAIMGGKVRVVPPQSVLGVHRTSSFRLMGKDPAGGDSGYQRVQTPESLLKLLDSYVRAMGVNREILSVAQAAPAESIRLLSRDEVRKWRLGKERF